MASIVPPLQLLLVNGSLVKALVNGSIKDGTSARIRQVLLLLHDLARALRNEWLLLELILHAATFQSLVHLGLPAAIVLREGHIKVGNVTTARLLLAAQHLLRGLTVRRVFDLVRLECAVSERVILRQLLVI